MKTLILMLIISIATSGVRGAEEEGLFIADHKIATGQEFKNGEIVMRWKAERLKLMRAVFRHDTEDKKQFWLELDFTKWADPGDFYVFKIDGKNYHGFVVRGEGTNDNGGCWALGFTDVVAGRDLLAKIATAYGLPAKHTPDQTKGEPQRARVEPLNRSVVMILPNLKPNINTFVNTRSTVRCDVTLKRRERKKGFSQRNAKEIHLLGKAATRTNDER